MFKKWCRALWKFFWPDDITFTSTTYTVNSKEVHLTEEQKKAINEELDTLSNALNESSANFSRIFDTQK